MALQELVANLCSYHRSCILKPSGNKKERSERLQAMKKGITYNEESFEEDRRLVRLWKEGDRDAAEELLRKYDPLICREAASAREEDREDLIETRDLPLGTPLWCARWGNEPGFPGVRLWQYTDKLPIGNQYFDGDIWF